MATAKNTFVRMSEGSNRFSRRWGTVNSTVDPYITGYHFIYWSYLPPKLAYNVSHAGSSTGVSFSNNADVKNLLASACQSVTLPGATVNKAEFNGLGNIKWAVPTNVDWDNNCSIKFLESSGLPIFSVIHGWVRMMRDYRAGVSTLDGGVGSETQYTKSNYAGTMYYWTTEPNGKVVEYHSCLTGLFPTKDPTDQFGHDLTAYDKLEIDIDFNVDYLWHEDWTYTFCQNKADEYHGVWGGLKGTGTINSYHTSDGAEGS